jgi:ubiquinol-cytochrome c reductase cytochrome b subunit
MKGFLDWLDQRTGIKHLLGEALYERIPGGARWRYVWGSALLSCFVAQIITGTFLWTAYSASSQTAWESVYYIQHQMVGGWFLRGLHHYTAQAMTLLLAFHMLQTVIDGAYKAPREVNFWTGLSLLGLVLGLSLTGYLLPWDQKGFWATKVATNIAGITPVFGPAVQALLVGGSDYGHHTLTRFFALHAGVIPGFIIAFIAVHLYLFRRHGITVKEPRRKADAYFWPDQVLMDAVVALAVFAVVLLLTIAYRGAELGAPADPSEPYSAARPEWYFLFLFQYLKYFPGGTEVWGAIVTPTIVGGFFAAMPFIGKWRLGHRFNLAFLGSLFVAASLLTWASIRQDRADPEYQAAVASAKRSAERAVALASSPSGIPVGGAASLLRDDAYTAGPKLFARHCASCHLYNGHDGTGWIPKDKPSAPDLGKFGTRAWVTAMVDPARIDGPACFGNTKFANGKMAKFIKKTASWEADRKAKLGKIVLAVSADAGLKGQAEADKKDASAIEEGRKLFAAEEMRCSECHQFHKVDSNATAVDLTGYGSHEWLTAFISDPADARFYGEKNDRMPAFGKKKILDPHDLRLLVDWLRGEWYEPPAGVVQR